MFIYKYHSKGTFYTLLSKYIDRAGAPWEYGHYTLIIGQSGLLEPVIYLMLHVSKVFVFEKQNYLLSTVYSFWTLISS